jgi:hypothetical protein
MGLLDSFEVLENVTGAPYLSITKNGVSFNKCVLEKMGCPQYVKALIDRDGKRMAIVACDGKDRASRAFYKDGRDTSYGVRWNNYDLKQTIENMMGWDLLDGSWKVFGEFFRDDCAMIFDFMQAESMRKE